MHALMGLVPAGLLLAGCAGDPIVVDVRSGDLVELDDGSVVRYAGVQAPLPGDPHFETARQKNHELVYRRKVSLVLAQPEPNDAGELVAFVYAPVEHAGKTQFLFVQGELALWGLVQAAPAPPGLFEDVAKCQEMAKELGRGPWLPRDPATSGR